MLQILFDSNCRLFQDFVVNNEYKGGRSLYFNWRKTLGVKSPSITMLKAKKPIWSRHLNLPIFGKKGDVECQKEEEKIGDDELIRTLGMCGFVFFLSTYIKPEIPF